MQFLALLTTLCLSLASTYAAPIEPPPPEVLEVDDIDIRKWSEGNGTSYKISFQLRNPYPEANIEYHAITTCSGSWKEGANDYNVSALVLLHPLETNTDDSNRPNAPTTLSHGTWRNSYLPSSSP